MATLACNISKRTVEGKARFESTVSPAGTRPTKLTKDWGSRKAAVTATKSWAEKHGYETVNFGGTDTESTPAARKPKAAV